MPGGVYLFNEITRMPMTYSSMPGLFRAAFLLLVVGVAACRSSWPAQQIMVVPGSATSDSLLEGGYRWTMLDGKAAPQEFPANSGTRILFGTLDLRGAGGARTGTGGRFSLRFTTQPGTDTVRTLGFDGRFVIRGDSLLFTPDGRENNPPVLFRYTWRPNGELALTDSSDHVWVYVRR